MQIIKNIQFQQLINLLLLIYLAMSYHTLQATPLMVAVLILYAMAVELLLKDELYIPFSAAVTAIGVVLMLGWLQWYIPFIAIALALAQKRFMQIGGRHIFNPSNFALIAALVLFYPKALPITGQLGKESVVLYIVLLLGTLILIRVNRLAVSAAYLGTYIFLSILLFSHSDPNWSSEHFFDSLYSSSFIVYIFFMLTDPVTTPKTLSGQALFGLSVAVVTILLNYAVGVRLWHMFIALFLVSIVSVPFVRKIKEEERKKYLLYLLFALTFAVIITLYKPRYFSM
jgi:hypothetical protein